MGLFDKLKKKPQEDTPAPAAPASTINVELSQATIDKLAAIDYFSQIGKTPSFDFGYTQINTIEEAIELSTGIKWNNIRAEEHGDLSVFLLKNHPSARNDWNAVVDEAKRAISPYLSEHINLLNLSNEATKALNGNALYDIACLAASNYYRQYCTLPFFERLYEIYNSGHFPCGWKGQKGKGIFLIF